MPEAIEKWFACRRLAMLAEAAGITLSVIDGRLAAQPASAMPDDLRDAIAAEKDSLRQWVEDRAEVEEVFANELGVNNPWRA